MTSTSRPDWRTRRAPGSSTLAGAWAKRAEIFDIDDKGVVVHGISSLLLAGIVLEIVKALVDEAKERIAIDLQVVGGNHRLIDFLLQDLVADLTGEGRVVFLQEATLAWDGFDNALVLKLGVGLGDGVAVDPQLLGQGPDGRERVARAQRSGGCRVPDLVDHLEVSRLAGFEIDVEQHSRCLSYDRRTVMRRRSSVIFAGGFLSGFRRVG